MARKSKTSSGDKQKKPKPVTVELVKRTRDGEVTMPYRIMERIAEEHHPHLGDAKIAIAYKSGWKADTDGRVKLVAVRKGSDLDRDMHGYDFVVILNRELWNASDFNDEQRDAIMDHALCHCEVQRGVDGEPKEDERKRTVYRIRHPDIHEYKDVVARHGLYMSSLEEFAASAIAFNKGADTVPLFAREDDAEKPKAPKKAKA